MAYKRRKATFRRFVLPWAVGRAGFTVSEAAEAAKTSYRVAARRLQIMCIEGTIHVDRRKEYGGSNVYRLTEAGKQRAAYYEGGD